MTPETQLKQSIKQYLTLKRIFWWYNLAGVGSYKGLPDLFAFHKNKLYAIEVKAPRGKLSKHQIDFLARIEEQGGIRVVAYKLEDVIELFP